MNIGTRPRRCLCLTLAAFLACVGGAPAGEPRPPNILFIMADDLGYNDLSCQGATNVETPGIDRLAKEGMRFTDAHTPAGLCSPSRYGVLTGRYPWRRSGPSTWASPGAALLIESGRMTTASLLKQAGYATGVVGKWHLGFGTREEPADWSGELKPGPLEVGFDYFFGDVANRWGCYVENHRIVGLKDGEKVIFKEGAKRPVSGRSAFTMVNEDNATVLHDKAIAFIEKNRDRPFYLHYVPNNVHTPLTPNKRFQGASRCGVYGDFIKELDWSVGEMLATLDRLGLATNTLVFFTSDNGGVYEKSALAAGHRCCSPLNGQKADIWEGGNRVPFLARWPGRIPAKATSDQLLCITDMLATFAALTGQTLPPGAGPDSIDQMPALLAKMPAVPTRTNLIVQSGKDTIHNRKVDKFTELWAVREGTWKLVLGQGPGPTALPSKGVQLRFNEVGMTNSDISAEGVLKADAPPQQLYDLAHDLGETRNVYREHPDIAARLGGLFKRLRDAEAVRPGK